MKTFVYDEINFCEFNRQSVQCGGPMGYDIGLDSVG